MAEMTMIEESNRTIKWECSECKALVKDRNGFERKVERCPKCGAEITQFYSLFDENGDYTAITPNA